jgi:hypothetical protein
MNGADYKTVFKLESLRQIRDQITTLNVRAKSLSRKVLTEEEYNADRQWVEEEIDKIKKLVRSLQATCLLDTVDKSTVSTETRELFEQRDALSAVMSAM